MKKPKDENMEEGDDKHKRVLRPWSVKSELADEFDAIAAGLKTATHVTIDRSKLMTALAELVVESEDLIVTANVISLDTLKAELSRVIAAHEKRTYGESTVRRLRRQSGSQA